METPFGEALIKKEILDGVYRYYGEGPVKEKVILKLEGEANKQMPAQYREPSGWYTGTPYLCIVVVVFSHRLPPESVEAAQQLLLTHYPLIYELLLGGSAVAAATRQSFALGKEVKFVREHADEWIEERHWNDSDPRVTKGKVVVKCFCPNRPDWGKSYFTVNKSVYSNILKDKLKFIADVRRDRQIPLFDYSS